MEAFEISAKTIEEAVNAACTRLNVAKEALEYEVLEYPAKGLFGMIGVKDAKISVKLKEAKVIQETPELDDGETARSFLTKLLEHMNVSADIVLTKSDENISIRLEGENVGILIGHRGETLDAIQYLTGLVVNRSREVHIKVFVDVQDYRLKREKALINLAERLAKNVLKTKKDITLEPMNPNERRIIHSTLQNDKFVKTYSRGDEPYRRVVVTLKDKQTSKNYDRF